MITNLVDSTYFALIMILPYFISQSLLLWLWTSVFHPKKQKFSKAMSVVIVTVGVGIIIQVFSLFFNSTVSLILTFVSYILQIVTFVSLVHYKYRLMWWKSIIIMILTYFFSLLLIGFAMMVLVVIFLGSELASLWF